jgi:hypothetical protein
LFGLIGLFIIIKVSPLKQKAFLLNCCAALFANFYMNTTFFKILASYTGQIAAAQYVNQPQNNNQHIYSVNASNNVFQFYCRRPVDFVAIDQFKNFPSGQNSVFYFSQPSIDYLIKNNVSFKVIKTFANYPQENILPAFINKQTRYKVLDRVYLITK